MTTRTNTTQHFEVSTSDGQLFGEKCRNSIGGFANMMARMEARFGERLRSTDQGQTWEVNGLTVTFTEVEKL